MWTVLFDDDFAKEFAALDEDVKDAIRTYAKALEAEGPMLGRPYADTLSDSKFANMKELRPTVNKVEWRVAFAFDTAQQGILLCAAAKGGKTSSLVYRRLIKTADTRFDAHQKEVAETKAAAAASGRKKPAKKTKTK